MYHSRVYIHKLVTYIWTE